MAISHNELPGNFAACVHNVYEYICNVHTQYICVCVVIFILFI